VGSTGKSEVDDLIQRCHAVGWQVTKTTSGHWKVDTHKGIFTIPSTPSSSRSMANTLADAKRRGLNDLEAKLSGRDDRDRQRRLASDRAANDAKLERIQVKIAAIQDKAGVGAVNAKMPNDDPTVDVGLGKVNGIAIVAIAPAMVKTPLMTKPGPFAGGEELLLATGSVVFRCRKKGSWGKFNHTPADQVCDSVFTSSKGLLTHIGYHTIRTMRDADNAAHENEKETDDVSKQTELTATAAAAAANGSTDALKSLLTESLTALVAAIDKIGASTIEARNAGLQLIQLVQELKPEIIVQEPDPELVAKAKQFDALAATLGSLINTTR
jgi:hypothetical protein